MLTCAEIWSLAVARLPVRELTDERLTLDVTSPDGAVITTVTALPFDVFDQESLLLIARVCPRDALSEFEAMRLGDRLDAILALRDSDWGLRLVMPCAALDWDRVTRSIRLLVDEVVVIRRSIDRAAHLCFHHLAT